MTMIKSPISLYPPSDWIKGIAAQKSDKALKEECLAADQAYAKELLPKDPNRLTPMERTKLSTIAEKLARQSYQEIDLKKPSTWIEIFELALQIYKKLDPEKLLDRLYFRKISDNPEQQKNLRDRMYMHGRLADVYSGQHNYQKESEHLNGVLDCLEKLECKDKSYADRIQDRLSKHKAYFI